MRATGNYSGVLYALNRSNETNGKPPPFDFAQGRPSRAQKRARNGAPQSGRQRHLTRARIYSFRLRSNLQCLERRASNPHA